METLYIIIAFIIIQLLAHLLINDSNLYNKSNRLPSVGLYQPIDKLDTSKPPPSDNENNKNDIADNEFKIKCENMSINGLTSLRRSLGQMRRLDDLNEIPLLSKKINIVDKVLKETNLSNHAVKIRKRILDSKEFQTE